MIESRPSSFRKPILCLRVCTLEVVQLHYLRYLLQASWPVVSWFQNSGTGV
jgi:hypothetical protein